ncbi:MAG: DUF1501 domain-containing protein [Alphaproteobacteria bacterium]|nr:DUF1501 domain-containing protein [Alphaproteobacteria bacterium]
MLTRRKVLQTAGTAALLGSVAPARVAFAAAPTENRLAIVILRGGLDGLHAVPPYGDPRYRSLRPSITVPSPGQQDGALDLNGTFGLHPALAPLQKLYEQKQLLIVQAATTGYAQRSHFDGQNVLENGTNIPYGAQDGWLNRALLRLNDGDRRLGLSVGHSVPLVMRGDARVQTWAPTNLPQADDDFLTRLAYVYEGDSMLSDALREARQSQDIASGMMDRGVATRGPRGQYKILSEAAGRLLASPDGPRIAVFEAGGWDTHFGQIFRLRQQLGELAAGLMTFKENLGPAWDKTTVIVLSEFGRTAAENGSRGTDHGVGGIALLLGGAVAGGRFIGDWPGLSERALYEGRDVQPTTDYRVLLKAMLRDRMGLDEAFIEDTVFPASRAVPAANGLFRSA